MRASAIVILFLAFVLANAKTFERDFEEECPRETAPYKVVPFPKPRPYEKRIYPALHWVTTKIGHWEFVGFMKLLQYNRGQNSDATKINMTTPVVTTWEFTDKKWFPFRKDELSFYIPKKFQKHPPEPTNPDVYLEYTPLTLYAWTYDGYSDEMRFQKELMKLEYHLIQDGMEYNTSVSYYAGYSYPWQYKNRKNEVWILAIEK